MSVLIEGITFDELTPDLIATLLKQAGQPSLIFQVQAALDGLKEAVAPWDVGDLPPTMLGTSDSLQDAFSEPDLARLREIKQRVDPLGVLVGNYPLG